MWLQGSGDCHEERRPSTSICMRLRWVPGQACVGGVNHGSIFTAKSTCTYTPSARPFFAATTCAPSVPHGSVGSMRASGARSARRHVAHFRLMCASPPPGEQPAPPYVPFYVPHGPCEVRRAVLAGREARVDPEGAPARPRASRPLIHSCLLNTRAPLGRFPHTRNQTCLARLLPRG